MKTIKRIRVLCVDDHPLMREGISSIVANESDMELVGEAGSGRQAVEQFRQHRPDVVLMDLRMPEMDGIEATRIIREETPEAKIIALTSYNRDQDICRALEAGKYAQRDICSRSMPSTAMVLTATRRIHHRGEPHPACDCRPGERVFPSGSTYAARAGSAGVRRTRSSEQGKIAWKLSITGRNSGSHAHGKHIPEAGSQSSRTYRQDYRQ